MSEPTNCAEVQTMDHLFPAPAVGALIAPALQVPTRLLLVEDNTSTRFAIRAFFQRVGYSVDAAADHATASQLLDDNEYEVVITDLNLGAPPSNEGMDIVSQARRRQAHACVIMLTAFGSAAVEDEARRRGADLFCAKPIALRDLSAFIDELRRQHGPAAPAAEHG